MSNIFEKHIADKTFDEYISRRDALLCVNAIINGEEDDEVIEALAAVVVQIHKAPAADVVPVVRCFECERYISFGKDERGFCSEHHIRCYPIGYCSNGQK